MTAKAKEKDAETLCWPQEPVRCGPFAVSGHSERRLQLMMVWRVTNVEFEEHADWVAPKLPGSTPGMVAIYPSAERVIGGVITPIILAIPRPHRTA